MPVIAVNQLKNGMRLAEEVHTALGGLLFPKGVLITDKEIELLKIFLVQEVTIEDTPQAEAGKQTMEKTENPSVSVPAPAPNRKNEWEKTFHKAVDSYKKWMMHVQGGVTTIPVMEVREMLSPLLKHVQEHPHVLLSLGTMENAENYMYEHSVATGMIAYMIARWMKIPENEWMQIALAGTLMDIGKSKIDPAILWKPSKLTPDEFEEMKKHTVYGYQMIKASPGLNEGVALAALQHHEREDGSGYPLRLKGNQIHTYSKIVAVADVFHAMSSYRVYQQASSPYLVAEKLLEDSFGKLDPTIVHTFVNGITQFSVGTLVELSDGRVGKIVFTDRRNPTRPLVETKGKIVNLSEERQLHIQKIL